MYVQLKKVSFHNILPYIITGLGTFFAQEYTIKLKPNCRPFALNSARNNPLPLGSKVQLELQHMESLAVISPVQEPTPWCTAVVVVLKDSGQSRFVWIQAIQWIMPKVETTIAQLSGAKLFIKWDANSGFWQIPLANESKLLTMLITSFGHFCFNKLPFGISSAPEIF